MVENQKSGVISTALIGASRQMECIQISHEFFFWYAKPPFSINLYCSMRVQEKAVALEISNRKIVLILGWKTFPRIHYP